MPEWIRDRCRSLLDNALYEGVRLLITAFGLQVLYATLRFVHQQPLQWTVVIVFATLSLLAFALLGLGALKKKNPRFNHPEPVPPLHVPIIPSVQAPMMPMISTPDFSDPAYDRFWPSSWRDGLITRGQRLVEQWTTRLDYPEKQRRENESRNWLSEANEYAREHLRNEENNEFIAQHRTAGGRKEYEFCQALIQAGTEPGSEDGDLAIEIFCKVKLLERYRSDPTPAS